MGIKLKNKYTYVVVWLVCIYILGATLLCAGDTLYNDKLLSKDSYFKTNSFLSLIYDSYSKLNDYYIKFKDYSLKNNDEKVTDEEIKAAENDLSSQLEDFQTQIHQEYSDSINQAKADNDNDEVKRLTGERDKKLDDSKKQYTKTADQIKKELISQKDNDYNNLQEYVSKGINLNYYMINTKTGDVYSNIANVSDINDYIKKNALYAIKIPSENDIKNGAYNNPTVIYFIVPKDINQNSSIAASIKYYEKIRQGYIIKLICVIVLSLVTAVAISILKKQNEIKSEFFNIIKDGFEKVPMDLRIILFAIITIFTIDFFYTRYCTEYQYSMTDIRYTLISAAYILFFIVNIKSLYEVLFNKEKRSSELKRSFIYKVYHVLEDSLIYKSIFFKSIIIICLTAGVIISIYNLLRFHEFENMWVDVAYIIFYIIAIPYYVMSKIAYINKIIKGSGEIAAGNFEYPIEEKGKGKLVLLAHNINNMKEGFKKSVKSQIKSERLKAELITNVSHDLKTPLTSIINYVDLLKKEGITKEEMEGYIGVLDRKSQRLKVLIEDLFEVSKVSSGAVEINIQNVDVTALLKQSMGEMNEKIKNSGLNFKINIPEKNIYLKLDGKKTWRVFDNLINNILKYSQPNTRVYIDASDEGDKVKIIMKNISAYEMEFNSEEIFERFKRGDKSRNTEGSGLGLAIAKSIVELEGGSMNIEIDGDLFKVIIIFYK